MSGRANVSSEEPPLTRTTHGRDDRLAYLGPHISATVNTDRVAERGDMVTLEDAAALAGMAPSRLRRWATQKRPRAMAFQHSTLALRLPSWQFDSKVFPVVRFSPGRESCKAMRLRCWPGWRPPWAPGRIDTPSCPEQGARPDHLLRWQDTAESTRSSVARPAQHVHNPAEAWSPRSVMISVGRTTQMPHLHRLLSSATVRRPDRSMQRYSGASTRPTSLQQNRDHERLGSRVLLRMCCSIRSPSLSNVSSVRCRGPCHGPAHSRR